MGQMPCLFCQSVDGSFRSVEHVFPECLGNRELVLPRGVVCDHCNNVVLSQLNQVLCEFSIIKFQRAIRGMQSKDGTPTTARFDGVTIDRDDEGGVRVEIDEGRDEILRESARVGRMVQLQAKFRGGRRLTPRYASKLSRSLLGIGLECAWLDHGPAVCTEPWDHVRNFVLGSEARHGFVAIAKHSDSNMDDVKLTYNFDHGPDGMGMWVMLRCYGASFGTHSRHPTPARSLPPEFAALFQF